MTPGNPGPACSGGVLSLSPTEFKKQFCKRTKEGLPNSPFAALFIHPILQTLPIQADFNAAKFWSNVSKGRIKARYVSPFAVILHERGVYPLIGKGTWIGHWCIIDGSQGLQIGEDCDISSGVQIYTHSTALRCARKGPKQTGPVTIGNRVFIGPNSVISYGCTIADNSMILPLTHIPPNSIVLPRHKHTSKE